MGSNVSDSVCVDHFQLAGCMQNKHNVQDDVGSNASDYSLWWSFLAARIACNVGEDHADTWMNQNEWINWNWRLLQKSKTGRHNTQQTSFCQKKKISKMDYDKGICQSLKNDKCLVS